MTEIITDFSLGDGDFTAEQLGPVIEFLPDGRIVVTPVDMGELTIETESHGRVTIESEPTRRVAHQDVLMEVRARRQEQLIELIKAGGHQDQSIAEYFKNKGAGE